MRSRIGAVYRERGGKCRALVPRAESDAIIGSAFQLKHSRVIERNPEEDRAGRDPVSQETVRAFLRGIFRFVCVAAVVVAAEIYRRRTGRALPLDRRAVGTIVCFGSAGLLGVLLLWRSRAGTAQEVLESAAMVGFWTGFLALFA